jgi:hypothetical protein
VQVALVKQELAAAVRAAGLPKLECLPYVPSDPPVPAFFVGEVDINPNTTFGGCDTAEFTCTVLVGAAEDLDGQLLLDQYLSRDGDHSIRAALLAARGEPGELALNGAVDDLKIVRINGYRTIPMGDDRTYYGATIAVQVLGS